MAIQLLEQRGKCGGLTAAGCAGDEHEPGLFPRDRMEDRRQIELIDARNLRREFSQNGGVVAALSKDVHAETSFLAKRIRTVAGSALDQIFRQTTIPVDDIERNRFGLKWRQLLDARLDRDSHELA